MKPEDILTTHETCRMLGITRQTLYVWIEQGKIKPWRKLGGRAAWFFLRKEAQKAIGKRYTRTANGRSQ
ncbi:helix-turn-helix transcriptional regulator [Elusimicrobiota bacterium]